MALKFHGHILLQFELLLQVPHSLELFGNFYIGSNIRMNMLLCPFYKAKMKMRKPKMPSMHSSPQTSCNAPNVIVHIQSPQSTNNNNQQIKQNQSKKSINVNINTKFIKLQITYLHQIIQSNINESSQASLACQNLKMHL